MSDVVAVALITGLSTASAGVFVAVLAVIRERIRSEGETERQAEQLRAEQRRIRAEVVREGRLRSVERLQNWVEKQLVLAADTSALIALAPAVPGADVQNMINERLAALQGDAPEEVSINTVLSHFSDSAIIEAVRRMNQLHGEVREMLQSPEVQAAVASRDPDGLRTAWKPIVDNRDKQDVEIAALNRLLEAYIIAAELP